MNIERAVVNREQEAKTKVFVMYDGQHCTWNVMTADRECLFFGTSKALDEWLVENQERYQECNECELMSLNKEA